ncbi:hypothetical protein NESM_000590300 [Novymonas esmeraldas]|uniref:BAG domain-containing protein n=1 Tax=Novymonas esmeraldas TaxID=1808958 RepID=A0AAW0ETQ2_9TRYP
MTYYGYQPEQTKAQIRSTRGETIDLALPVTCLVEELRVFLIEEYGYEPNTRLLYNGLVADENSYVCDYPYGSLMIATPADMQSQRQSLPPRQTAAVHQRPTQAQQHQHQHQQQAQPPQQHHTFEPPRPAAQASAATSASADVVRKAKTSDLPAPTSSSTSTSASNTARKASPAAASAPAPPPPPPPPQQEAAKGKRTSTVVKHRPKSSPRKTRSASTESSGSQGKAPKTSAAAPPAAAPAAPPPPPPPPLPSTSSNGASPAPGSGRAPSSNGPRTPPWPQAAQETPSTPSSSAPPSAAHHPPPPPPPPARPSAAAEAPAGTSDAGEENHRMRVRVVVECHVPSLQKVVQVAMTGESSVVDLVQAVVAAVPGVAPEAQVICRGKVLPKSPQAKLFDLGIRTDTRVFVASGEFSNPEKITLLEVEEDIAAVDRAVGTPLTDVQRKGYYEELMRILFRTDGLQSLEGEWRQRRKDAVRRITSLQDALGL